MDTSSSLGRAEMLRVVEAVAQEKGISTDEVLEAMEQAYQTAARRTYGAEHEIVAEIDRRTGDVKLYRDLEVALLDRAQQFRLQADVHLRDFIEQNRRAIGQLKTSDPRRVGPQRFDFRRFGPRRRFESRGFARRRWRQDGFGFDPLRFELRRGHARRRRAHDRRFDEDVVGAADHHEMFDIVAAQQQQLALAIDVEPPVPCMPKAVFA